MPEGVPDSQQSICVIDPAILIAFWWWRSTGYWRFSTRIFTDCQTIWIRERVDGSWLGIIVIMLLIHLLWAVGVHGTAVIKNSFINPILLVALTENIDGANNILLGISWTCIFLWAAQEYAWIGFIDAVCGKITTAQSLRKSSDLPGLFNINEPVIFRAPIVYNPYLIIPFIITPLINVTIAYFASSFGFVDKVITGIPWISPVGIGAFLGTGGDFRAILIALINLGVSILCYYPFFKMYDGKLYTEQLANHA